jgi:DNA-directed RNA polymerase subunit RPC12/RpoP
MPDGFYEAMRQKGFSYNTTTALKKFQCPYCGFEFSMMYARTIACQGCSEAWKNCPKLRCAKCDSEFPMTETPNVSNELQQRNMAEHISKIVVDWNEAQGNSPKR